jgi:branched-chain amino acid transport system permease protein
MTYPGKITVERWTELSRGVAVAAIVVVLLLAAGPLLASGNVVDRMTPLFVYIILAVMWNALAGYGGLVSIGQQAFFGLGGYFAIRLSEWGVPVFPALVLAIILVGLLSAPISVLMLRLRAGEFAVGMWVASELLRLLVNLDPVIQGDTGRSLIALSAFDADTRRSLVYWLALVMMLLLLGAVFVLLRSKQGAAIQAIRDSEEAAASVGVRVRRAKQMIFVLAAAGCGAAGVLWLATSTTFQPRSFFGVQWTAYMIFMVLVGGLGRFEGPILGAVIFFLIEAWFGATGVWYLIGLGLTALAFALFLPRGIWGSIEDAFGLRLLPVGYTVRIEGSDGVGGRGRPASELQD